ncbi:MAG: CoB--CoM heterodisulfide reductase iron-sulfur subunit B family protein [Thermoplasmata archaeon]
MELLYYPGCTLKTSAKPLERSAFAVARVLGYELVEMKEWNCCGVVASLTTDDLMRHLAPLRNLIHVEDEGRDRVVCLCEMCSNTLKQTHNRMVERPEDLEKLSSFMDEEHRYKKSVRVLHFLELLRDEVGFDKLRKRVKRPLKDMSIMPYYGCMLVRPREVAIDDAERPVVLSGLLRAIGATVVENPFSIECCGSYHTIDQKEFTSRRAYRISEFARRAGAEAIALSCPLCRYNLDVRGKEAERLFEGYRQMPVFYYTQLLALALGVDAGELGLEENAVDPAPLLRAKGIMKI